MKIIKKSFIGNFLSVIGVWVQNPPNPPPIFELEIKEY